MRTPEQNRRLQLFWEQLKRLAGEQTSLHATVEPPESPDYIEKIAPSMYFMYQIHTKGRAAQIEMHHRDKARNKALYDHLARHQAAINAVFGDPLEWHRRPEQGTSYIGRYWYEVDAINRVENWPRYQREMVEAMIKLEAAMRPYLVEYFGAEYREGTG